ncbi:MAG TPA: hypothetical protein DCR04_06920 [Flavobacteriales bacterium]|nr:hypothetical protein [Flavobacteriales bacterium]
MSTCLRFPLPVVLIQLMVLVASGQDSGALRNLNSKVESLDRITMMHYNNGELRQALTYQIRAAELLSDFLAETDSVYLARIQVLATISDQLGEFGQAENYYAYIIEKVQKSPLNNSRFYCRILNDLGRLQTDFGKNDEAELNLMTAAQLYHTNSWQPDADYGIILNNLGLLFSKKGDFLEAREFYKRALQLTNESDLYSNTLAILLDNLGQVCRALGEYEKAVDHYKKALEGFLRTAGVSSSRYASTLNNLGLVYADLGLYSKAERSYLAALEVFQENDAITDQAITLSNLGMLCSTFGSFTKAVNYWEQAQELLDTTAGEFSDLVATTFNNLANVNEKMGNYSRAEEYLLKALELFKTSSIVDSSSIGIVLNNLGLVNASMNNLNKAEDLYLESLAIKRRTSGFESSAVASTLKNLSSLHSLHHRDYAKAEMYALQALEIRRKLHGESSSDYLYGLEDLRFLYQRMGSSKQLSAKLIEVPLKIVDNMLANMPIMSTQEKSDYLSHEEYIFKYWKSFYAWAYLHQPLVSRHYYNLELGVKSMILRSNTDMRNVIESKDDTTIRSSYERWLSLSQSLAKNPEIVNSGSSKYVGIGVNVKMSNDTMIITGIMENGPSATTSLTVGDRVLSVDGIQVAAVGMPLSEIIRMLKGSENTTVKLSVEDASHTSNREITITRSVVDSKSERTKKIEEAEQLEKQLSRASEEFMESLIRSKWEKVRDELSEDEASIEFSSFQYIDSLGNWTDSTLYTALILRSGDTCPRMVTLFEQRQLDALTEMETDDRQRIALLYRGAIPVAEQTTNYGNELYDLVWAPLEEHLQGVSKIHFSPSGSLHQISFSALTISEDSLLMDRYELNRVGSTAAITFEREERPPSDVVLFGGMDYSMDTTQLQNLAQNISTKNIRSRGVPVDLSRGNEEWSDLPGTRQEVEGITRIAQDAGVRTTAYLGEEAIEERYKNLGGKNSPTILHIATHGFFFPDPEKKQADRRLNGFLEDRPNVYKVSDDPMNRSGILFSGANASWTGNEPTTAENGILTAREATYVPLINTELVVLSACQTGLGEIKGSEGVFGLQRAFKAAGAEYLLMSLWKVPDQETAEFMESFYGQYLSNHTIPDSYHHAQRVMRDKYPNDPYKWAGFVLMR